MVWTYMTCCDLMQRVMTAGMLGWSQTSLFARLAEAMLPGEMVDVIVGLAATDCMAKCPSESV
jgi:hypothetical protein